MKIMKTIKHSFMATTCVASTALFATQAGAAMDAGDFVVLGTQNSTITNAFAGDQTNLNQLGTDSINWGNPDAQTRVAFDPTNGQMIFGAKNGKLYRYDFDAGTQLFSAVGSASTTSYTTVDGFQDVTVMNDGSIITLGVSSPGGPSRVYVAQASDLNQQGTASLNWGVGVTSMAYDSKNDNLVFGANSGKLYRYSYDKIGDSFTQVGSTGTTIYSTANGIQDVAVMADGTVIVLGVSSSFPGATIAYAAKESDLNQQGTATVNWGTGVTSVAYDALNDELLFAARTGLIYRYTYDKIGDSFTQVGSVSTTSYSATNGIQDIAVAPVLSTPGIPEPASVAMIVAGAGMLLGQRRRANR